MQRYKVVTMETLLQELKRYVGWSPTDEAALHTLHPILAPEQARIAELFYQRIMEHEGARIALLSGESSIGRLKGTLVTWMDQLLTGPWDESYFQLRCRIGRVHVRIGLPQHYMFGAMSLIRQEFDLILARVFTAHPSQLSLLRAALSKILDLELAIMSHTHREDLLAQQSRNERLATFGQLVGAIGHELRNPLGVIESSLYILKGRVADDPRIHKHMHRIGEQLTVANNIITGLLDMIRDKPLLSEPVKLRPLLDRALESLVLPPSVLIKIEGLDELPLLSGDPTQLQQALRNLLENALQALGTAGTIAVHARHLNRKIELVVADSGPGVDPAIRNRLFEPLITARAGGIGLGLSLVKRYIERHSGTIVYAPDGPGARFVIVLPIHHSGASHV